MITRVGLFLLLLFLAAGLLQLVQGSIGTLETRVDRIQEAVRSLDGSTIILRR